MKKRTPMYVCLECGKKFYSTASAERASLHGCPKCNGVDIDVYYAPSVIKSYEAALDRASRKLYGTDHLGNK